MSQAETPTTVEAQRRLLATMAAERGDDLMRWSPARPAPGEPDRITSSARCRVCDREFSFTLDSAGLLVRYNIPGGPCPYRPRG